MDPNNRSLLAARNKKKNIHILKVPLTIVPDQVPKKWVSGFGGFMREKV